MVYMHPNKKSQKIQIWLEKLVLTVFLKVTFPKIKDNFEEVLFCRSGIF